MLEKYNMIDCCPVKTPMNSDANTELSQKEETLNESRMENVFGSCRLFVMH